MKRPAAVLLVLLFAGAAFAREEDPVHGDMVAGMENVRAVIAPRVEGRKTLKQVAEEFWEWFKS